MVDQHLTLVTALLAAAVGGGFVLLGSYLTNRATISRLKMEQDHQSHSRRTELLRERGEELYELTDKWLKGLAGHYLSRTYVMQGKISLDEHHELTIRTGEKTPSNFGRIEMLIDVYFPAVRPQYDTVIAVRGELNKIDAAHRRAYERGETDGAEFLKPYVKAQHSIEEAGMVLKKRTIECIQAL